MNLFDVHVWEVPMNRGTACKSWHFFYFIRPTLLPKLLVLAYRLHALFVLLLIQIAIPVTEGNWICSFLVTFCLILWSLISMLCLCQEFNDLMCFLGGNNGLINKIKLVKFHVRFKKSWKIPRVTRIPPLLISSIRLDIEIVFQFSL